MGTLISSPRTTTLEHRVPRAAQSIALPSEAAASPTRARLSQVLLLYFLGTIVVMTLAPFHFAVPEHYRIVHTGTPFDMIANVLLFVPLGFLYPLTRPSRDDVSVLRTILFATLISCSIEAVQLFEAGRFSSAIDVLTNAGGAGIGAIVARSTAQRIRVNAKLVGRLSLEIPLIGLIYLLVPAVLVASMSAAVDLLNIIAVIPLAFVGARLIIAVQRNHFSRSGLLTPFGAGVAAGAWALLGCFPLMPQHTLVAIDLVLGVALLVWWESSRPMTGDRPERRFEMDAVRGAAPHIAAYVLVVIFLPLAISGLSPWHFSMALTGANGDIDLQQIQLLVPVSTTTVLGYLLAEARGRRDVRFKKIVARVVAECAGIALALEVCRGFESDVGASGSQLLLMLAGAFLGACIYYHQRAHVRWILANRRS